MEIMDDVGAGGGLSAIDFSDPGASHRERQDLSLAITFPASHATNTDSAADVVRTSYFGPGEHRMTCSVSYSDENESSTFVVVALPLPINQRFRRLPCALHGPDLASFSLSTQSHVQLEAGRATPTCRSNAGYW